MDDSSSDSSAQTTAPTVASVLGVKGSLRFRKHGASQKAHVVLRRVELSDNSSAGDGKGPVAYFSLFAQKRIEVKPGKEILLAVASDDGTFTDQAVIFEGDLFDSETSSEAEIETQVAEDDPLDLPSVQAVPPKMRRTWTKQFQQDIFVSSIVESAPLPLPIFPSHASVGVQAQPLVTTTSVQANIAASPLLSILPTPLASEKTPFPLVVGTPVRRTPPLEKILTSPPGDISIPEDDRLGSLSPMSLGSEWSSPPQSPLLDRPADSPGYVSPLTTEPSNRSIDNPMAASQTLPGKEQAIGSSKDPISQQAEAFSASSTPDDMDLQSPSSSLSSDIPGFITGSSARAEPLTNVVQETSKQNSLELPLSNHQPEAPSLPSMTVDSKPAVAPNPPPVAAPRKPVIQNPFVSGGFMTEFVGSPGSLTVQKMQSGHATSEPSAAAAAQPMAVSPSSVGPAETKLSPGPLCVGISAPSQSASESLPKSDAVPPSGYKANSPVPSKALIAPPMLASTSTLSQSRSQPAPRTLPPRPTDTVIASSFPQKPANGDASYSRVSSSSDHRLSFSSTGSISNPLNIRPSHPVHPYRGEKPSTIATPLQQPATKKRVIVGSGWPHTRQANGHAFAAGPPASPQAVKAPARSPDVPLSRRSPTPDSIRSSKTPPGLSNFVPYLSPSPPGLLHSSSQNLSAPKAATSSEAGSSNTSSTIPLKVYHPSPSPAISVKHGQYTPVSRDSWLYALVS
ncbi:hypothetical protein BV22DRAFT_225080 [Leucogyrophana mollusca]|uniref:Uncharacterized protein n=1 Tax=Leucogyrophana mollusca TaxID=85980 RepID=A0ACB8BQJ5_9AGAM|nr:hypothetical protein BV22DRAFT_225080 [Leucogyrophana mollusca]